jgi:hypothetical protein
MSRRLPLPVVKDRLSLKPGHGLGARGRLLEVLVLGPPPAALPLPWTHE